MLAFMKHASQAILTITSQQKIVESLPFTKVNDILATMTGSSINMYVARGTSMQIER